MRENTKEFYYINDKVRIRNTKEKWEDYLNPDGWINWAKVYARPELYIVMITGVGTGKTYGSANFCLSEGKNLGYLQNTAVGAEDGITSYLATLKDNRPDYYGGWTANHLKIYDETETMRVKGAGLRNSGTAKRARDFYANAVIYDEFNQSHEQAEIRGQNVQQNLDKIVNRWTDRNHQLDHIFMFGNKDGDVNILAVQMLYSLGIYALQPYSEIFVVEKEFMGDWIGETVVFNPKIDKNKVINTLLKWKDDPVKYKKEISQWHSGTAQTAYFNDDTNTWLLDRIKYDFLQQPQNKGCVRSTWYLYQTPECWLKIDALDYTKNPDAMRAFVSTVREMPKSDRLYCIGNPQMDGVKTIPQETRDRMVISISNNKIVYDTVATKIQFLTKNKF